jgi:holliday junction DNA helicase RuvA
MIAYLQGKLHEIGTDYVVILTGGVGYHVFVSKPTLNGLHALGGEIELKIHTVVREDSFNLYGFKTYNERELFLKLLQVSGIGPKLALTIISGLPPEELAEAIGKEDLLRLTAIPGIGKKTAERLIVELKDKIFGLFSRSSAESSTAEMPLPISLSEEAISALTNLGYSRQEALKALKSISKSGELSLEVLVREGLKALS